MAPYDCCICIYRFASWAVFHLLRLQHWLARVRDSNSRNELDRQWFQANPNNISRGLFQAAITSRRHTSDTHMVLYAKWRGEHYSEPLLYGSLEASFDRPTTPHCQDLDSETVFLSPSPRATLFSAGSSPPNVQLVQKPSPVTMAQSKPALLASRVTVRQQTSHGACS